MKSVLLDMLMSEFTVTYGINLYGNVVHHANDRVRLLG